MFARKEKYQWEIEDVLFGLVLMVAAFLLFSHIGSLPLLDPDEPVYAQTPKEMLAAKDWISPQIFGEFWYDKPPLYYWLTMLSFKIFGIYEWSCRLPSVLMSLSTLFCVYVYMGRRLNKKAGMLAALVLATSVEFFYLGKAAVTDMTLVFCLTAAFLSFLSGRFVYFYFFAGLAVLAKGLIGIVFPVAIIGLYILLTRRFHLTAELLKVKGLIIFLVVALPWHIAMYISHGSIFIDMLFGFNHLTRFTQPEHGGVHWYFYFPVLILGFFPWSAILPSALYQAFQCRRQEGDFLLFFVIWATFIFLFFSTSATKLLSYILPLFPPLAMIVDWYLDKLLDTQQRERKYPKVWIAGLLLLSFAFAGLMFQEPQDVPALGNVAKIIGGVFLAMGLLSAILLYKRFFKAALVVHTLAMITFCILAFGYVLPTLVPVLASKEISQDLKNHYDKTSPVIVQKFLRPGVVFYSDISTSEAKVNRDSQTGKLQLNLVPGKGYYLIRESVYRDLDEGEKRQLKILSQRGDRLLLLK